MPCSTCGGKKPVPKPRAQAAKAYSPSRTIISGGGYGKPVVRMSFSRKK